MNTHSYREDPEYINELLLQYANLKAGKKINLLYEESFEQIIDHFDDQDDLQNALDAVDTGLTYYPFSSTLTVKKADIMISLGNYQEALGLLENNPLLDKNDLSIYLIKTDAYLALEMPNKAAQLLEDAIIQLDGDDRISLLMDLTDVFDDYEAFDKLFDCLKLVLELEPNHEEALYKICFWTDFTGRNEESIRLHLDIIDNFPYNELAWFNLASAYQGIKLYEKCIDAYKFVVAINEKFDYAYRNMADAFIRLRKFKEAIEALEFVLHLSRPEDVIYEALGHCYEQLKKYTPARQYYRKASNLNSSDLQLYYKVAKTYMKEANWIQAIKFIEQALAKSKYNPTFNLAIGECKMHLKNYDDAAHHFKLVLKYKPKMIAAWEALIKCLYADKEFAEAEALINLADEKLGKKPLFQYYRSAILFAKGKSKEALLHLEDAVIIAPKLLKKFIDFNPFIMQNQVVVDLLLRLKRNNNQ
jgi:tetratricopeptide (TPR) repeat protein